LDTTADEVKEVFSKCGVIMEDITTGEPKIRLYKAESGALKGDALITFFKEESVPLAINLLDDAEFRLGDASTKIRVQQV
jgi:HIV Tat-specific factor 1